jgi:hypothetical protein
MGSGSFIQGSWHKSPKKKLFSALDKKHYHTISQGMTQILILLRKESFCVWDILSPFNFRSNIRTGKKEKVHVILFCLCIFGDSGRRLQQVLEPWHLWD